MNCNKARSLFSAETGGELSGRKGRKLDLHLGKCRYCQKAFLEYKENSSLLLNSLQNLPRPPLSFSTDVMRRIAKECPELPRLVKRNPTIELITHPAFSFSLGLLILALTFFFLHGTGRKGASPWEKTREPEKPVQMAKEDAEKFKKTLQEVRDRIRRLEKVVGEITLARQRPATESEGLAVQQKAAFQETLKLLEEVQDAILMQTHSKETLILSLLSKLENKIPPDILRAHLKRGIFSAMDLAFTEMLARMADPESVSFFLEGISRMDIPLDFRKIYAEGLLRICDPAAVPLMKLMATSLNEDEYIRKTLLRTIFETDPMGSIDFLTELARFDSNTTIRGEALKFLAQAKDGKLVKIFEECLKNELSPDNALICIQALANLGLGNTQALEALNGFIINPPQYSDPVVIEQARALLKKVQSRIYNGQKNK